MIGLKPHWYTVDLWPGKNSRRMLRSIAKQRVSWPNESTGRHAKKQDRRKAAQVYADWRKQSSLLPLRADGPIPGLTTIFNPSPRAVALRRWRKHLEMIRNAVDNPPHPDQIANLNSSWWRVYHANAKVAAYHAKEALKLATS